MKRLDSKSEGEGAVQLHSDLEPICNIPPRTKGAILNNRLFLAGERLSYSHPGSALYSLSLVDGVNLSEDLENAHIYSYGETEPFTIFPESPLWYDNRYIYMVAPNRSDLVSSELTILESSDSRPVSTTIDISDDFNLKQIEAWATYNDPIYNLAFAVDFTVDTDRHISVFNSTAGNPTFSTHSTTSASSVPLIRDNASVFFAPYGNNGVLLAMGGKEAKPDGPALDMTVIDILDLETLKWYQVRTNGTGDQSLPEKRQNFCGWVTSDGSNPNATAIIIYGGESWNEDQRKMEPRGDIWTLKLPEFVWVNPGGESSEGKDMSEARHSHLCLKYGKNHGFILGGETSNTVAPAQCHAPEQGKQSRQAALELPPVKLLDFSTLTFQDTFHTSYAEEDYNMNPAIVGAGSNGNADDIFLDENLRKIFNTPYTGYLQPPRPNPEATNTPSGAQPAPTGQVNSQVAESFSRKGVGISGGTIAGIVVGVVFFVLSIAGLMFFLIRRRRRQRVQGFAAAPGIEKSISPDSDEGQHFVPVATTHAGLQHRRSLSPPPIVPAAYAGTRYTIQSTDHTASAMPGYEQGAARTYTREELDSPSSDYSSLMDDHDGQHREIHHEEAGTRSRRMSDVSSLAETIAVNEVAEDARIGGDVSPVISPVQRKVEENFVLERERRGSH